MGYITQGVEPGNIGETLASLTETIHGRWSASEQASYTSRLLNGPLEYLQKKVGEEAVETILAAGVEDKDHLRYEIADLMYHLMVLMERRGLTFDDIAGELNARMK
ncbi:MAG: phosphoribosyl-ATP diphosphatase [Coriobacteriales bacterium]|jgi:phosphoribosyl-ATP pyrophosphohydrolase